jgi:hypothetical protein
MPQPVAEQPIEFNVIGCPANTNRRQNLQAKAKRSASQTQSGSFILKALPRFNASSAITALRASNTASHTAASVAAVAHD